MYNKQKFIKSLKAVLEIISKDLSQQGKAQKEEIKKQLEKLGENVETPQMDESQFIKG